MYLRVRVRVRVSIHVHVHDTRLFPGNIVCIQLVNNEKSHGQNLRRSKKSNKNKD